MKKIREIPYVRIAGLVLRLLKTPFWLQTIEEWKHYTRVQDFVPEKNSLSVWFLPRGEANISIIDSSGKESPVLTFESETRRGSPHTRNALLILAEAIRLDNEENKKPNSQ